MKKLISIFAAVALVGSLAAAPKKPVAPAKPVVAAPTAAVTVTAPTASSVAASGKALGLSFGLTVGYVTDMFKQGDKLKLAAGAAGGGGLEATYSNANSAGACGTGLGLSAGTASSCSASGSGSSVSLNGIDIGLKVQFDITSWLFVRSGANYVLGLKNTYTASRTFANAGNTLTTTDSATMTANGNIIEIPMLLGFNLVSTNVGTLYFAAGLNYSMGTYDQTLSATQSLSTGTALTYTDIENKTKYSGLGIQWLVGGKTKITDSVSLFGEVKFLSSAGVGKSNVTGTTQSTTITTTGGYATAGGVVGSAFPTANGAPVLLQGNTAGNFTATNSNGVGGLDLSYTRWQVGVQYEL